MKIKTLFITLFILLSSIKNVVAEEPEINIHEDSKYVESNLYTQIQNNNKLKYTSVYYSTLHSEKQCELYNYNKKDNCSVPFVNIEMELILSRKLYTDINAYEGYSLRNQVDKNTYIYGKNFEVKPDIIYFSSDVIDHGCYDSGTFVNDIVDNFDKLMSTMNGTSFQFEKQKRINQCLLDSKSNKDIGKYSEKITIRISLDDLKKLLVSNYIEVKIFDDVYVFPWQVVRDLKLFYDAVYKTHESEYLINKPDHSSPFTN